MKFRYRELIDLDLLIFTLCVFFNTSIFLLYNIENATIIIISLSFIYFIIKYPVSTIFRFNFVRIFILFFLWACFTSISPKYDLGVAILTQRKMLAVLMFSLIHVLYIYYNPRAFKYMLNLYLINLIVIFIYAFNNINVFQFDLVINRGMDVTSIDPNTWGYFIFNGIFALSYQKSLVKKRFKFFYYLVFFFVIFFSFFILLSTATRGGMIMFLLVTFLSSLVMFNNFNNKVSKYLLILPVLGILIFATIKTTSFIQEETFLGQRFQKVQNNELGRTLHLKEAYKLGLDNFLFGVGGGNYSQSSRNFERGSFSHSSYSESFANYGFPGLLLLLIFYYYVIRKSFSNINLNLINREQYYLILIYLILFCVYNIFYVTYLSIIFQGLFFGVAAYSYKLRILHRNNKKIYSST